MSYWPQVDPEVPDSIRMSLEENNMSKKQQDDRMEQNRRLQSRRKRGAPIQNREEGMPPKSGGTDIQLRLGRSNVSKQGSRPGSATGQVPSIIMLTSVDHSDANKYDLNLSQVPSLSTLT